MDGLKDIRDDLKEIKKDIKGINTILSRNTTSLEIHIARTEANEHRIEKMEKWWIALTCGTIALLLKLLLGY